MKGFYVLQFYSFFVTNKPLKMMIIINATFVSGRDGSNEFTRLNQSISNNIQKISQNGKIMSITFCPVMFNRYRGFHSKFGAFAFPC